MNSPNNPSGITYTEEEIKALADLCRKHKILVLSDEIYARLSWKKFTSIAKVVSFIIFCDFTIYTFQYYPEGTIVTTGFSKWASIGGWRAGYALFPKELRSLKEAVSSAGSHSYTCLPTPIQYALLKGSCSFLIIDFYVIDFRFKTSQRIGRLYFKMYQSFISCWKIYSSVRFYYYFQHD